MEGGRDLQQHILLQGRRKMFCSRGADMANELVGVYVCGQSPLCLGGSGGMPPRENLHALRSLFVHSEPTFTAFY